MGFSVRLSRGLRLRVPAWLAFLILPVALMALVAIVVVDVVVWLVTAPSRLAAAVTGGSKRLVAPTPVDIIRLNSQRLATTILRLEQDGGFVEDTHFHKAHRQARRWESPDGRTSLTVRYDAADQPIAGDWHGVPGT
jgi:hypothetical protein